jgi:hypothetical protein
MLTLDPHIMTIAALTSGIGYLMIQSGIAKSALELKRRKRICPSCGRHLETCGC